MSTTTRETDTQEPESLTAEAVAGYLSRHPDFLVDHPDLLATLSPPVNYTGERVVDLQRAMVERARAESDALRRREKRLLDAGEDNQATQLRVQAATLELMRARSFESLIHGVTRELPVLLGLEAVALCVEMAGESLPEMQATGGARGVALVDAGTVDALLGVDEDIALRAANDQDRALFGPAGESVRSVALLRMRFGKKTPPGMLALGASAPDAFHPELETQLVDFLARVLEHCIRRWLGNSI